MEYVDARSQGAARVVFPLPSGGRRQYVLFTESRVGASRMRQEGWKFPPRINLHHGFTSPVLSACGGRHWFTFPRSDGIGATASDLKSYQHIHPTYSEYMPLLDGRLHQNRRRSLVMS